MTMKPHLKLTLNGSLGSSGEIFSCSLALQPHDNGWFAAEAALSPAPAFTDYMTGQVGPHFSDIVNDCTAFWARPDTDVHGYAVLKTVKLVAIGADGHYASAPQEAAVNVAGGGGGGSAECPAWQIARKITLETDGDLHRVKGGFYLPLPIHAAVVWDGTTGLFTSARTNQVKASVVTFLNDLANNPGFDFADLRPCVASQGRHNKNGTVRLGPDNYEVKRVSVGRRPDVIRRRANKRTEAREAASNVSF